MLSSRIPLPRVATVQFVAHQITYARLSTVTQPSFHTSTAVDQMEMYLLHQLAMDILLATVEVEFQLVDAVIIIAQLGTVVGLRAMDIRPHRLLQLLVGREFPCNVAPVILVIVMAMGVV